MKIVYVSASGRQVEILIDPCDAPIYHAHRWVLHRQGLMDPYTNDWLHRLILQAPINKAVLRKDGNRFNFQRDNLFLKDKGRLWLRGQKRTPGIRTSKGEQMVGVNCYPQNGLNYYHAELKVDGKQHTATFGGTRSKLGDSEAYRRAVCWRIGMVLRHGFKPDDASMEIFRRLHPRFCPFKRPPGIVVDTEKGVLRVALRINSKPHYNKFPTQPDEFEAMRRAVFWRVGTLLAFSYWPDEESMAMLDRMIAMSDAPLLPEEMYSGNDDYRGSRVYADDDDQDGLEGDEDDGEEDRFNTRSVPCGSTSFYG